jgi:hypothetical protein
MEGKINPYLFRYDGLCAPGHMDAMVFSNTQEDHTVLKTLVVIPGDNLVCPCTCGLNGKYHNKA